MKYFGFIFLIASITLCYLIARAVANYNRNVHKSEKQFWAKESESNNVRRVDISTLDYVVIPSNALPLNEAANNGCGPQVKIIENLSSKKILNLSQYTNTDLKLMYGPANLDTLTECDNNYTELIKTLDKMGSLLIDCSKQDLAKAFLEYSVSIGSDISATYANLGSIYMSIDDKASFNQLLKTANGLSSLSKPTIIAKLNNIKSDSK